MSYDEKFFKDRGVNIHGKRYITVADRVLYLREFFEGKYSISTTVNYHEARAAFIASATLTIYADDSTCQMYTGHAEELCGQSGIGGQAPVEVAETSAVGRACAMAGIGVIDGLASADEMRKAKRGEQQQGAREGSQQNPEATISEGQVKLIFGRAHGKNIDIGDVKWKAALLGASSLETLTRALLDELLEWMDEDGVLNLDALIPEAAVVGLARQFGAIEVEEACTEHGDGDGINDMSGHGFKAVFLELKKGSS